MELRIGIGQKLQPSLYSVMGPEFLCAALDTLKDLDLMILRCYSVLKFCDLKLNFDLKQCCVQNATFEIRGNEN